MRLTKSWGRLVRRKGRLIAMLLLGLSGLAAPFPLGSSTAHGQIASPGVPVPSFWDPRRRPERPDLRLTLIRFVSEVDYPPFNYAGPDGN
ncbi:MAG: transporter substrate-binding domain-containing protein, partial [Rhodoplanes sp.]